MTEIVTMTKLELQRMIEEAGRAGGHAVLADFFDIDFHDRKARAELREDFRWARRARKTLDKIGGRMLMVIMSVLTGAALFWLGQAIVATMKGWAR